jgi:hypothetical protein
MIEKQTFSAYVSLLMNEGYLSDPRELVYTEEGMVWVATLDQQNSGKTGESIISMPVASYRPETEVMAGFKQVIQSTHKPTALLLSRSSFTRTAARTGKPVHPYLDDFAQMFGIGVRVQEISPGATSMTKKAAVLLRNLGGLCRASSLYDLHATAMVLEKGCQAQIVSWFLGGGKKISIPEALAMRLIYRYKYSKKATGTYE